jgi:hypothetical protein
MSGLGRPMMAPRFGVRVVISDPSPEEMADTVMASSSAYAAGSMSATSTAGSLMMSAGSGMVLSGPEAPVAQMVLSPMNQLGSQGAANWSAQNPVLGGLLQMLGGAFLMSRGADPTVNSKSPN